MSQNRKKGSRKHQDMMSQRAIGRNATICRKQMDVKYVRMKCDYGTKCYTVGMAKNAVDGMFTCSIYPPKGVQTGSSVVDE